jgi:hypothetical protein
MKITPLAQGSGVPAQSDSSLGRTASPERLAAAKAIAAGQEVPQQSSGDPQVDRAQASIKKIKMKTQVSTNRDDTTGQFVAEEPGVEINSPTNDTVEQTQSTEETKPLSPQFAALAKAKRALQVKEREIAQREAALQTQVPAGNDELIARLKSNPLSVLQENGVTYDQLTEAILNNQSGTSPELQELKTYVKKLEEKLDSQFLTRDQQQETQVLNEIKREIVQLVDAQPEQFEAIRAARAEETVKDLIHRTWKETGEVLDTTTAAELVENQLIDEALPFARIKKVQSRLTPAQEEQIAQTPIPPKQNTKVMRTLTNRDNATPQIDRRARAIAAMQGTLKKG